MCNIVDDIHKIIDKNRNMSNVTLTPASPIQYALCNMPFGLGALYSAITGQTDIVPTTTADLPTNITDADLAAFIQSGSPNWSDYVNTQCGGTDPYEGVQLVTKVLKSPSRGTVTAQNLAPNVQTSSFMQILSKVFAIIIVIGVLYLITIIYRLFKKP